MLKQQRDRQRRRLILAALAAIVLIGGFMLHRSRSQTQANGTTYKFGKVTRGDVRNSVTATGTIQPWKTVDVKSNIAGRIDRLAVDLGDRVEAGQLIAIIDPTDAEAAVKKADADLASARARAAQARASKTVQPALTSSAIRQAQAGVESARKSLEQSKQSRQELQQQLAQLQGQQLVCLRPLFPFVKHGRNQTEISTLFPHLGSVIDDICLVRSMTTEAINHDPAHMFMNTGPRVAGGERRGGRRLGGAWVTWRWRRRRRTRARRRRRGTCRARRADGPRRTDQRRWFVSYVGTLQTLCGCLFPGRELWARL